MELNQNHPVSDPITPVIKKKRYRKKTAENRSLILSGNKKCNKCKEIKPLSEFHKHKDRHGGVMDECKSCALQRHKDRYEGLRFGPERMKALKAHAKKAKVPFDISEGDLENLWERQKGLCYYTKIPMQFSSGSYNTVSIDRINSFKGYTFDNLCLCCDIVNYMKSDLSYERFLFICTAIVENSLPLTDELKTGYQELYLHRHQKTSSRNLIKT